MDPKKLGDASLEVTTIAGTDKVPIITAAGNKWITLNNFNKKTAIRAYPSSAHAIDSGAWGQIQLNATSLDVLSEWNASTYRFEPSQDGIYLVEAQLTWDSPGDNVTCNVSIYKNISPQCYNVNGGSSTNDLSLYVSAILELTTSDYIQLRGQQNSGSSKNISSGSYTYMNITRI